MGTVVKKSVLADVFASEFSCFVFEHYCGCVHPSMSLLISVVLVFDFFVMVVVVCCTFVAHLIVSASTRLLCQIQFTLGGWSSGSQSYLPSLTQAFSNPDNICQKIFQINWPCPSGTLFLFFRERKVIVLPSSYNVSNNIFEKSMPPLIDFDALNCGLGLAVMCRLVLHATASAPSVSCGVVLPIGCHNSVAVSCGVCLPEARHVDGR